MSKQVVAGGRYVSGGGVSEAGASDVGTSDVGTSDVTARKAGAFPGPVEDFEAMWASLAPIGRAGDGGYYRLAWTDSDLACREWFRRQATSRGMVLDEDVNGNLWAWWGGPGPNAVVTGSHLDSVPGGGAYDGPLGVVAGFAAIDRLVHSYTIPPRPVAVVSFADEEGGRFGVACAGSRLMTGQVDPEALLRRADVDRVTMADAMRSSGLDPDRCGEDPQRVADVSVFVELHIEQGRCLADVGAPVGVASAVWPHGRWRFDFKGQGDHAGTTRLADRRDPLIPLAQMILATRREAERAEALATVGRVEVHPGATNAIAGRASAWLDARAPSAGTVRTMLDAVTSTAAQECRSHRVEMTSAEESWSDGAEFSVALRERIADRVAATLGDAPRLATGAGHDAAILAARVPTAMLFVRNPSGTSHDPSESATIGDCLAGVDALTSVLADFLEDPDASGPRL